MLNLGRLRRAMQREAPCGFLEEPSNLRSPLPGSYWSVAS